MPKLTIESDGSTHNTRVRLEDGTEVRGVTAVRWEAGVGDTSARIKVEAYPAPVSLEGIGDVVVFCPGCTEEMNAAARAVLLTQALQNEVATQKKRTGRWRNLARILWREVSINDARMDTIEGLVAQLSRVIGILEGERRLTEVEYASLAQDLREYLHSIGRAAH